MDSVVPVVFVVKTDVAGFRAAAMVRRVVLEVVVAPEDVSVVDEDEDESSETLGWKILVAKARVGGLKG